MPHVVKTSEQLRSLLEEAEKRKGPKGIVCVQISTKEGEPVLVAKILPYGEKGLVFTKIDPSLKDEMLKYCDVVVTPTRHVRKFKLGIREWNRLQAFMEGKPVTPGAKRGKYIPAHIAKKVLLTPGRGVKRPRTK
ncbi:MAG: hypothetical protein DRJ67_03655 [Thermoprotei archaeon]|nr:MAG: hypothetical protein DRJ67_03655 [Thermoprotei archaeon]